MPRADEVDLTDYLKELPVGTVVQVVNTQTGEIVTGTTLTPVDDTIPQNTEGVECMTLAITPTNASNKLLIQVVANSSHSASNPTYTVALFQDNTVNALAAIASFNSDASAGRPLSRILNHFMTAGTTNLTTFKVRIGANVGGTLTFNGIAGARYYGGVMASSITITEIKA